jgi:hypothetical protein
MHRLHTTRGQILEFREFVQMPSIGCEFSLDDLSPRPSGDEKKIGAICCSDLVTHLVASWDELLQGPELLVYLVPSPLHAQADHDVN